MESQGQEGLSDPRTKTVLIVDDDESVLNLLEILVKCDGFKVLLAKSGEEAIQKLSRKPDALLLDLVLPGASGVEVLRHLRQSPPPVPPVIVVTGQGPEHPTVKEAKQDPNVVQFFPKPINQDKLLLLLHKVLKTKAPPRKQTEAKPAKEGGAKP